MTPEFMAIVAVGVALAGLHLRMYWFVQRRMDRLEDRVADHERRNDERFAELKQDMDKRLGVIERALAELRERMARLEGLLDGLRESVVRSVA